MLTKGLHTKTSPSENHVDDRGNMQTSRAYIICIVDHQLALSHNSLQVMFSSSCPKKQRVSSFTFFSSLFPRREFASWITNWPGHILCRHQRATTGDDAPGDWMIQQEWKESMLFPDACSPISDLGYSWVQCRPDRIWNILSPQYVQLAPEVCGARFLRKCVIAPHLVPAANITAHHRVGRI